MPITVFSIYMERGKITMKQRIHTDKAPAAIGPYSQAVLAGNFLYVSGQLPLDPVSGAMVGETAAEQAEQSLKTCPPSWRAPA
jgi:enamine deaminase RidA (YjgF/YER057c/UK114 family)